MMTPPRKNVFRVDVWTDVGVAFVAITLYASLVVYDNGSSNRHLS